MIRRKQICAGLLALSVGVISANAAFAGRGDEGKGDEDRSSDSIGDPRFQPLSSEPACKTTIMASVGGPTLRDSKTLAIRWMGYSNYELVYGDKIILLDNGYYNRAGTQYKDLGFDAAEVKRADLIIIGHAHADHMSDTAQVGAQTKAPIIAAPITITKLLTQPVNPKQLVSVTGTDGKILKYPHLGITVQPILGLHGQPPKFTSAFGAAYTAAAPPPTPSEAAAFAALGARGSTDPNIITQGTLAYIITFDDGFRLAYRDSGGYMTSYETAAMNQIGRVDILLGAVAANIIAESQALVALPMLETYRPAVWIPGHHEEEIGGKPDRATEPLFQYAKNAFPSLLTVSKQFREPTCFDTRKNLSRGNGEFEGPSENGNTPSNSNLNDWMVQGLYF